jgi:hypothetical protein
MPKYQMYFDTQAGEVHHNVTIDEDEILADIMRDILAEMEERNGQALRGWREGIGDPVCRWEGRELDAARPLPEQGVRPNDVLRVAIKRPALELQRDGDLLEVEQRTELQSGDEILIGKTRLRFEIKDQRRKIDQSQTFIQRVQEGRSFQQAIWEMSLVGALAGLLCWFLWSLIQIPESVGPQYYDVIAFTLLGAFIGGLSVSLNDRRLGDAIVPLGVLFGVVSGAAAGAIGGWLSRYLRESAVGSALFADALSWLIAGGLIGFGTSLRWIRGHRSRVLNGLLGGMAGGLIGGLAYLMLANLFGGDNSQALGMALTGMGITGFIALAPVLARQGVLEFVMSGDQTTQNKYAKNKKLWAIQSGEKYVIGRLSAGLATTMLAPELSIYLPDPLVEPRHAVILTREKRFYIEPHFDLLISGKRSGKG